MQNIWLIKRDDYPLGSFPEDHALYSIYHERNGKYLEREGEATKFKILPSFDDTSSTVLFDEFMDLLNDLIILLEEAKQNNDTEIVLHILEIIVLCKFCIWNDGKYNLTFSPWGGGSYPEKIPKNIRQSIAGLADILSDGALGKNELPDLE